MATQAPLLRFREKNPNMFQLQLSRANTSVLPGINLALKLELRTDPKGRILSVLDLTQPNASSVLVATLPALTPGLYYVDLVQVPANLPPCRSGLCLLEILPIGSLETLADVVGLSATLDESSTILTAELDGTPTAVLVSTQVAEAVQTVSDEFSQQVDAHKEDHANPHATTADQVQALAYPEPVSDVAALLTAAVGSTPKLIICQNDPTYSDQPTLNLWDGTNLIVFAGEKRN